MARHEPRWRSGLVVAWYSHDAGVTQRIVAWYSHGAGVTRGIAGLRVRRHIPQGRAGVPPALPRPVSLVLPLSVPRLGRRPAIWAS